MREVGWKRGKRPSLDAFEPRYTRNTDGTEVDIRRLAFNLSANQLSSFPYYFQADRMPKPPSVSIYASPASWTSQPSIPSTSKASPSYWSLIHLYQTYAPKLRAWVSLG